MYITCQDIEKSTGLEYHYILKAVKILDNVFTKDIVRRGNNNSLLFSSESAYTIFDKIKQFKEQKISLRQMKKDFDVSINQNRLNDTKKVLNKRNTELTNNDILEKIEYYNSKQTLAFNEFVNRVTNLLPAGKNEQELLTLNSKVSKLEIEINFLNNEYKEKIDKIKHLVKQLYDLENSILNFTTSNQRKNIILEIFKILV